MTSRTWGPDGSGIPISSANLNGIETDLTTALQDASSAQKGRVQLAGDLGGTAAAPTVATINGGINPAALSSALGMILGA